MRSHGTLIRWNDDRGFGFIAPANGKSDLFVHISEFPRESGRPTLNELISFEVVSGPDGNQRAVRIMRPGQKVARPPATRARQHSQSRWALTAIFLLALVAMGAIGYAWLPHQQAPAVDADPAEVAAPPSLASLSRPEKVTAPASSASEVTRAQEVVAPASPPSRCDGRTMCSQMHSCEEATYFILNCPNTKMDGNNDGVPCESQWCR